MPRFPLSDHCDGERFFNPVANARPLTDVIKWSRTRQRTAWPASLPLNPHPAPPAEVAPGAVAVTFVGHATFLIRTATMVVMTDPVFTARAGPFGRMGPRRVRPPAIAPSALPPVDLVLVSHNHYDHLQPSSLRLFADRAAFVAPLGVPPQLGLPTTVDLPPEGGSHAIATGRHVASAFRRKIHELDWWHSTTVGDAEITCVPAQHFSARTLWDRNRTLWCGYVVRTGRSIGMHFGTFQLTDEAIDEPLRALDQAREAHGVSGDAFTVLDFGETAQCRGGS